MLQYEELRGQLLSHKNALDELAEALGLEKMKAEIADLEAQAAEDGFWDDLQKSQAVLKRTSTLKSKVSAYEKLRGDYDDALAYCTGMRRSALSIQTMKAIIRSMETNAIGISAKYAPPRST